MGDLELQQNVMDELDFEPSIDVAHIAVAAEKGVVTLHGHVHSYGEKLALEKAVRRVKGVRAIADDVEVRLPGHKQIADDEIASRALRALHWTVAPEGRIQIKVENGWLTLSGEVEWQYQRRSAEAALRWLTGVRGVSNNIVLKPLKTAADIERTIDQSLKRRAANASNAIRVRVEEGGTVHLDGEVRDWHERDMAEQAAWSAPGVTKVHDALTVG